MIVTRDAAFARRIEALHNTGYARNRDHPQNWYGEIPIGWGHGRRMGELQGAVARVQLRRLDQILASMRASHDRIEGACPVSGLAPRARADAQHPGDSGYYCQFRLPSAGLSDEEKIVRGRAVAAALNEYGLHPWFMHDFEIHVYYNVAPLVDKMPMNDGSPWAAPGNAASSHHTYHRGTLPVLDEAFVTTIGINVPPAGR